MLLSLSWWEEEAEDGGDTEGEDAVAGSEENPEDEETYPGSSFR